MWNYSRNVLRTYATSHSMNNYAIISGISGWKKIRPLSSDGATNCSILLNNALANNRTVDVYIVSNEIERVILH